MLSETSGKGKRARSNCQNEWLFSPGFVTICQKKYKTALFRVVQDFFQREVMGTLPSPEQYNKVWDEYVGNSSGLRVTEIREPYGLSRDANAGKGSRNTHLALPL
jgi:hypothetical protein